MSTTAHASPLQAMPARLLTALMVLAVAALALATTRPVAAAPIPDGTGHQDFAYGTVLDDPTEDKPQSKVWFNDGAWWGGLWNPTDGEYQIHKLVNDAWVATGVTLDDRSRSHADYLWDGTALYVASVSGDSQAEPILLFKFTYDSTTDSYALDPDFVHDDGDATPEAGLIVGQGPTETVTIAKDSTGQFWITYTNGVAGATTRNVMINRSTTNEHTWGAPFALATAPAITNDDISAIVSFGTSVGVMWTSQITGQHGFGFSVHADSSGDTTWAAAETAAAGDGDFADDHINLKATADGRVLAAVKTNDGPDHIQLLVRATNGTWINNVVVGEGIDATRPQVVIDSTNSKAYVLYTIPVLAADTEPFPDQTIFYKSAPLGGLNTFSAGNGTELIGDPGADINDVSSTKQAVTSASGLLAIAASETNDTYYHGRLALPSAPTAPATPTGLAGTAVSTTRIDLTWNASPGATSYGVYRGATLIGTPAGTSFSDTGLTASTAYSYTVDAANAAGRSPKSAPVQVTTPADAARHPFTDIGGNAFEDEIIWLWENEITSGCLDGTKYCPKGPVTREQMASFLVRALGLPPPLSDDHFSDVVPGTTHAADINSLFEAGITQGCLDGTKFCPRQNVLREQMASFLARARHLPAPSDHYFSDVVPGSTHAAHINSLFEAGITQGCLDGTKYCPKHEVLREQMAAFLFRAFSP